MPSRQRYAGYHNDFPLEEYLKIADLANSIKGKMIVSVNDIPEMREAFSGLTIKQLEAHYTVGSMKRGKVPSSELLIFNFA